ncbi:LysM domain-containing protein, partial [Streptomyces sp. SID11385]|uniref:LysM peptidoglycan-binding domain-containing protein n=1 Tax=Streptomyces sp. SID11385 TaxID=2706031 RepID=UPI001EF38626
MARSSARSASPMPVPPRPRRTFGDVMKALLAVVALLALVLGVPFGLIQVGRPVPDGPPGEWLSSAIDAETLIRILMLVVWIAWAQFTACVLVEVKAAISGVGLPARVPGAGPSQLLARQLVAAVLLLGATAASFTPGIAGFGQQAPDTHRPTVAAAQQTPGGLVGGQQQAAADALARQAEQIAQQADTGRTGHQNTKFYRIQPPEGRHHDSLWEIAQRHLDDGRRYKEIYALNKDRVQPDGSRLSEASLIRPGWIMEMPADAHGGELVETPGTNPELSKGQQRELDAYAKDGQGARGGQAEQGGRDARAQQRPAARDGDTTTGHFTVPAHHEHAAAEQTATP